MKTPADNAARVLPALRRLPGEYDRSYRERQLIALGTQDTSSPSRAEWAEARQAVGGFSCAADCDACWRSELHRRGREIEASRV